MKTAKAASRYAQALLDLSLEAKVSDRISDDLKTIVSTVQSSPELISLLKSRIIKDDKKLQVLKAVFEKHVDELTVKLLNLLAVKKRMNILLDVVSEYLHKLEVIQGVLRLRLISAVALQDEVKNKIKQSLKTEKWKEIIFEEEIDSDIVGGFILRTDEVQFDASVQAKLEQIKQSFLNKSFAA